MSTFSNTVSCYAVEVAKAAYNGGTVLATNNADAISKDAVINNVNYDACVKKTATKEQKKEAAKEVIFPFFSSNPLTHTWTSKAEATKLCKIGDNSLKALTTTLPDACKCASSATDGCSVNKITKEIHFNTDATDYKGNDWTDNTLVSGKTLFIVTPTDYSANFNEKTLAEVIASDAKLVTLVGSCDADFQNCAIGDSKDLLIYKLA